VFPVEMAFDLQTKWLVSPQASLVDLHSDGPPLFPTLGFVAVVSLVEPPQDVLSTPSLPLAAVLASSGLAVPVSQDADDLHHTERGSAEVVEVAQLLAPSRGSRARRTPANHFPGSSTFAHPSRGSGSAA
jgi:hypothetical protein